MRQEIWVGGQSLITATFNGDATLAEWLGVLSGFGSGAGAGAINVLDTLSFRLVNPLHDYRNQLWRSEGLEQSWVGTTANGLAWVGTGLLYSAAAVWAWSALGGGTMDIAVSRGASPWFIHINYGVNGVWESAVLGTGTSGFGGMTIVNMPVGYVGTQITGIPVLLPQAVLVGAEAGYAFSCVTAAIRAFFRGWGI